MLSMLRKKRVRAALALFGLLAFAGAAVAYFTASGSGTGNAQVGSSTAMTINATIAPGVGGIVPGGNPATVSFTVNNPSTGNQYVNTVTLTGVQAFSDAAHNNNITGTGANQCDTSQFTMSPVTEDQDVASGTGISLNTNGSLKFSDSTTEDQDGCKNAYLVASFSSN